MRPGYQRFMSNFGSAKHSFLRILESLYLCRQKELVVQISLGKSSRKIVFVFWSYSFAECYEYLEIELLSEWLMNNSSINFGKLVGQCLSILRGFRSLFLVDKNQKRFDSANLDQSQHNPAL